MKGYVGIDGGGTKTEAVWCDDQGHILDRRLEKGSNPNDVAPEIIEERLATLLKDWTPRAVFAGMSGATNHMRDIDLLLGRLLPSGTAFSEDSDALNVLSAGLLDKDGCGVISGTGCVCYVRIGNAFHRIGGNGFLLDEKGSGYDIGHDGIVAALRDEDGRGPHTRIRELIREADGVEASENLTAFYQQGKTYIAAHAPLVFKAAEAGDMVAKIIITVNMNNLADSVRAAARFFQGKPFPVVLGGGIFAHHPAAADAFIQALPTVARAEKTVIPPVFGAITEARRRNGVPTLPTHRDTFMADYTALT